MPTISTRKIRTLAAGLSKGSYSQNGRHQVKEKDFKTFTQYNAKWSFDYISYRNWREILVIITSRVTGSNDNECSELGLII